MQVWLVDPSNFTIPYDIELSTALMRQDCSVTLFCRKARESEPKFGDNLIVVEHYYRLTDSGRAPDTSPMRIAKSAEHFVDTVRLAKLARNKQPNVIHLQWPVIPHIDGFFFRSTRRTSALVLTVHDTQPYHGNQVSRIQTAGWQKVMHTADRIIVHTDQSAVELEKQGIPSKKLAIIPHGLLNEYAISELNPRSPGGSNSRLKFLFIGHIKPYKGIDELLDAFATLPRSTLSSVELTIAGKLDPTVGDLGKAIAERSLEHNVSLELGFLSEERMDQLIGRADVVVFPYHRIDASGMFYKCLPYGKAIIASRTGIFAESLTDGLNALLVEPRNPGSLSQAIITVQANPLLLRTLQTGSREFLRSIPTWDEIAARTRALYEDISARKHMVTKT